MTRAKGSIEQEVFGRLPGGEEVSAVTLCDGSGLRVRVLTYGASIQSLVAPDRYGDPADVALGHATLAEYLDQPQYLGSTVGRVANRIAEGRFTLDGEVFAVPPNNGPNALHGGPAGFDKQNWAIVEARAEPQPRLVLRLTSPHGDQGFPGRLDVTARFELADPALYGPGALRIEYRATTDRPTMVNLTNHAYWNLAGEGSADGAMGHELTIPADHYLPTDSTAIPTGELAPVAGTPFDFRTPRVIAERLRDASHPQIRIGRGYDHNWVVAWQVSDQPRLTARVRHPGSGRVLEVHSDQPGLQFYSGNFLDATTTGKSGRLYRMGDAFVLEPQKFPDTPNQPDFGSLRLDAGETYRHVLVFRFTTDKETGEAK